MSHIIRKKCCRVNYFSREGLREPVVGQLSVDGGCQLVPNKDALPNGLTARALRRRAM